MIIKQPVEVYEKCDKCIHEFLCCYRERSVKYSDVEDCEYFIEERRVHWIEHKFAEDYEGRFISNYECSECHQWFRTAKNYCGECGVKMG